MDGNANVCLNEGMADSRLTAAVGHWAPRFAAGGVDPGDFSRITSTLTRWDDWCAAWCQAAAEHEQLGTGALAEGWFLRHGYPPAIVHSTERQRYYEALKGSSATMTQIVQEAIENNLGSVEKLLEIQESKGYTIRV